VLFTWLPQALVQTYNIYRDGYICTSSRGDFAFDLGMGGCNWKYPLNRARRIDYEVFQDAASLRVAAR
jgi:hypothetical protein